MPQGVTTGRKFTSYFCPVVAGCSPNTSLLEYLHQCGLTGFKEGCAEGDCDACPVATVGREMNDQLSCRSINSCLMPLYSPALGGPTSKPQPTGKHRESTFKTERVGELKVGAQRFPRLGDRRLGIFFSQPAHSFAPPQSVSHRPTPPAGLCIAP